MDFGALPPEINSGRMYVGPGPGPLLAAAVAWSDLAAELQFVAASYRSAIGGLIAGPWVGPSSVSMAAAAAPYAAWTAATSAQAEQAAMQAKVAAGAYETAFAATVPPAVIAANRSLLMALIATNLFGQNTPAIATAEAHYLAMWAQDAAAMYAYAGASATASQLTLFVEPPQTTNLPGVANQSVVAAQAVGGSTGSELQTQLSQLITAVPSALQNLATAVASPSASLPPLPAGLATDLANWNTIVSALTGPYSLQGLTSIPGGPFLSFGQVYAYAQNGQGLQAFFTPAKPITGALAPIAESLTPHMSSAVSAGFGGTPVSGATGRAALVGGLSVPQSWTQAAPTLRMLASALPTNMAAAPAASLGEGGVFSQMALSSLAGRALGATAVGSGSSAAASAAGSIAIEVDPAAATIIVIPALEE